MKKQKTNILLVHNNGTGKMEKFPLSYQFIKKIFILFIVLIILLSAGVTYLYLTKNELSKQLSLKKNAENIVNQYELQTENESLMSQLAFLKKEISKNFVKLNEIENFKDKIKRLIFTKNDNMMPRGGFLHKNENGYQFELKTYAYYNDIDLFVDLTVYKDLNRALLNDYQEYINQNLKKLNSSVVNLYGEVVEKHQLLLSTPSIWPVRGWISSTFGIRNDPFNKTKKFHEGLDIANNPGTPIKATADGIVTFVGVNGGYGNIVIINHLNDIQTRYAHLQSYIVKSGQHVKKGQIIGYLGNTGRSSGPHLHYEVRKNLIPVNPKLYIIE